MNYQPQDFLPIFVQIAAALAFIVLTMVVTHALGPKRHSERKMILLSVESNLLEMLEHRFQLNIF